MPVKFCSSCQNMLTPREDTAELRTSGRRQLMYGCRTCDKVQIEERMTTPVHRTMIVHTQEEKTVVSYDVTLDPTLPRTFNARCPNAECRHGEAVYYQSPVGKNDDALVLIFVCVACSTKWLSSDDK